MDQTKLKLNRIQLISRQPTACQPANNHQGAHISHEQLSSSWREIEFRNKLFAIKRHSVPVIITQLAAGNVCESGATLSDAHANKCKSSVNARHRTNETNECVSLRICGGTAQISNMFCRDLRLIIHKFQLNARLYCYY